jgi:uncharacterized protein YjcR
MANTKNTLGGAPKGNQNAVKGKMWSDALRKEIIQGEHLSKLVQALILKAIEGDMAALKEIGDRLEGKPVQSIEQTTDLHADVEVYAWQQ